MFPQHLLPQLSPNSAKIYPILLSLLDPNRSRPFAIAPMLRLMQLSDLSARACSRALHQLRDHKLIRRMRRRYHAPNVYMLLPYQSPAHSPQQATIPCGERPARSPDIRNRRRAPSGVRGFGALLFGALLYFV